MTWTPLRRFWSLLSQYKPELRQIYAYAIIIGVVNLTLPLGIQAIINYLQTGAMSSAWMVLVCFVLIGIAITGFLQVLQLRVVENIQQDLFTRSGFEFSYRLPKIKFSELDRIHTPELVNRFFDTLTIQKGLPKVLIDFSLAAFQITFGLVLLAIYSPYFIILGFALVVILYLIMRITGPQGLSTSLKESKYKYKLVHWLEEVARVNRSLKINPAEDFHMNRTDSIVTGYLAHREKHFQVLLYQFQLFIGFKVIVAAGLLLLGGFLVFQEQMNIGQFVAAEIVIILIINSVEKILRTIETIYDVLTALEKIGYVTDLGLDDNTGRVMIDTQGPLSVRADEIEFSFPGERRPVISDLSFSIEAGQKVLLKGVQGAGKTILLQLISNIHQYQHGEIYVNDVPIRNYNNNYFNNRIGVVLPVNQLFDGTILENIVLGRAISDRRVNELLEILGLRKYLGNLSDGIHTVLDSGGRRQPRSIIQKITLARTLIGNPGLLLMEEPLQFIDAEEKKRIIDYIMSPERSWTVIVVSDFYYWNEKCDQILELKK